MAGKNDGKIRCSFCGKTQDQVNRLISGPNGAFICDECIDICAEILEEEGVEGHEDKSSAKDDINLVTPEELKAFLDDYVIGQDQAKKVLSVAVYNHYKRVLAGDTSDVELQKSNILMLGPTGSGKTLLAQTLARVINVPFAIADATTLTEAGYVGEDVENILLKCGGAFDGLEKIIDSRMDTSSIGFNSDVKSKTELNVGEAFKHALPQDFVKFGLIPEFIGRVPITVSLEALDRDALIRILKEPKNSLIKQYTKLFELDGVGLEFTDDAVNAIADKALERKTGARGLRAIMEAVMLDLMYRIPSDKSISRCVIDKDIVEDNLKLDGDCVPEAYIEEKEAS